MDICEINFDVCKWTRSRSVGNCKNLRGRISRNLPNFWQRYLPYCGALEQSHNVSISRWSELLFQTEFQSYYQSRFYRNNLFRQQEKFIFLSKLNGISILIGILVDNFFFLFGFWESDVRFSKTYLPTLSY